jgi:hypothetical protein
MSRNAFMHVGPYVETDMAEDLYFFYDFYR